MVTIRSSRSILPAAFALLAGCAHHRLPTTIAEQINDYGYRPVDPLPVVVKSVAPDRIRDALPDETMRLAVAEVTGSTEVAYGPVKTGFAGRSYSVVLDYIKFATQPFGARIDRSKSELSDVKALARSSPPSQVDDARFKSVVVPIYVGVGVRLTATVRVNEGTVDLTNLVALGAAARAKQVTGTLVVQTLGISGEGVSTLIPIPSELNETTIQNAIMALGQMKGKIYDARTQISPRVVGFYNVLSAEKSMNGKDVVGTFISQVLETGVVLPVVDLERDAAAKAQ
jgi:hypothetical protein